MPRQRLRRSMLARWLRLRRFVVHSLLHADDPPHRLALGAAIGIWVTFTPTVGLQMVIVVFLAWLLRANKAIGVPIVWLSNPATFVPIFYPCYVIGRVLLGLPHIDRQWWRELKNPPIGWLPAVDFYWSRFMEIATPLWVGCVLVATLLAIPTYYVVYHMVRSHRLRRFGQLTPPADAREARAAERRAAQPKVEETSQSSNP